MCVALQALRSAVGEKHARSVLAATSLSTTATYRTAFALFFYNHSLVSPYSTVGWEFAYTGTHTPVETTQCTVLTAVPVSCVCTVCTRMHQWVVGCNS